MISIFIKIYNYIKKTFLEKSKLIHPEKEKIRNKILKELEEYKTSMKM